MKIAIGYAFSFTVAVLTLSSSVALSQSVELSVSRGANASTNPPTALHVDWLTDENPLFVTPAQPVGSVITISPTNNYSGKLDLSASCCGIVNSQGSVFSGAAVPGLTTGVGLKQIPNETAEVSGSPVRWPLVLSANSTVPLGDYTVRVRAKDNVSVDKSMDVLFAVLPPWPGDGANPTCTTNLQVLSLSKLDVYAWKAQHLAQTQYEFGTSVAAGDIGLMVSVSKPPFPLSSTTARVTFKNRKGWHTGIRNENSHDCATSGQTRIVEEGQTTAFMISRADTTTLVFSRPVCRAPFIWCWGQIGLDDTVQFSEGPFWALFGGRQVDIETVGDWGSYYGTWAFGDIS
jgi:hypothetical protein